jgi:hypothetical protein
MKDQGVAAHEQVPNSGGVNAANRSLKSGLAGIVSPPFGVFQGQVPQELKSLISWDRLPECTVERAVILVERSQLRGRHGSAFACALDPHFIRQAGFLARAERTDRLRLAKAGFPD